jgi:serine/threonine protein kinase
MEAPTEGLRVGTYELVRLIGAGGMGEVYLARDRRLRRNVAIKFVAAWALDPSRAKRLLQEARAVAALDHPNICTVHNVDIDGAGRFYMVMQ